jgi:hypothetical protein
MFQATNITPPEAIAQELQTYQDYLQQEYRSDNGAEVVARIDTLGGYMARSGKLKADAEWFYNKLIDSEIMNCLQSMMHEKLSTSTVNKMIEAKAKDYKYLLTWADRVNRSCTHQIDAMRSILSDLKADKYFSTPRT